MQNESLPATQLKYFEKIDHPKQQEFIHSQNNCVLCGSELELTHSKNEDEPKIKEEAYCGQCEMRTRAKIFSVN